VKKSHAGRALAGNKYIYHFYTFFSFFAGNKEILWKNTLDAIYTHKFKTF